MIVSAALFTPERMAQQAAYMAELTRDKQDDDWSGWCGFSVEGVQQFLGCGYRWRVVANGAETVGTYDTMAEASLVKAKLVYRLKSPVRGLLGLDGLS